MSLTKRTWKTPIVGAHTLTFTGSVSSATTKLTIVFQAASAIYGVKSSINVYVNGTKQSCTWTTNKTETIVSATYKTKMTSSQMTISKPFFTLKLADSSDGNTHRRRKSKMAHQHGQQDPAKRKIHRRRPAPEDLYHRFPDEEADQEQRHRSAILRRGRSRSNHPEGHLPSGAGGACPATCGAPEQ